jgi:hypothetical protein
VLIEAKTMRMRGHAQHDGAEYVPREIFEYWKTRDPLARYETFLNEKKLWDAKTKNEIDARIAREIQADVKFAEDSPFPLPETAAQGVYCEGCHMVEADWKRSKEEVMPPRSSVKAEWDVRSVLRDEEPVKPARPEPTSSKPASNGLRTNSEKIASRNKSKSPKKASRPTVRPKPGR